MPPPDTGHSLGQRPTGGGEAGPGPTNLCLGLALGLAPFLFISQRRHFLKLLQGVPAKHRPRRPPFCPPLLARPGNMGGMVGPRNPRRAGVSGCWG